MPRALPSGDLPSDVQELLRERVRGLEHVELLLFLRRTAPHTSTASRLALQLPWPAWVGGTLEELCEAELLVMHEDRRERRFAYAPTTPALDAAVGRLAEIYDARRADVIRLLNEHALERLRLGASRAFSGGLGRKKDG